MSGFGEILDGAEAYVIVSLTAYAVRKPMWCQARNGPFIMSSFASRLHVILESPGRLRPALVLHKNGKTFEVDHARWIHGKAHTFLAVGIEPGIHEYKISQMDRHGPLTLARDFFAKPRYVMVKKNFTRANYLDPETEEDDMPICWHCKKLAEDCTCRGGPSLGLTGGRKSGCYLVRRQRFRKILTMRKENVVEVKWL